MRFWEQIKVTGTVERVDERERGIERERALSRLINLNYFLLLASFDHKNVFSTLAKLDTKTIFNTSECFTE